MDAFDRLRNVLPDVSRETFFRLQELELFYQRWAVSLNLSALKVPEVWDRHILDSAQLWRHKRDETRWLDLGSGGGFPGLVVATLGTEDGIHVGLVESNGKKAAYLRNAGAELKLPVTVFQTRVEHLIGVRGGLVTARAFAPLDRLFEWAHPQIQQAGRALLHKGRSHQLEIIAAQRQWSFDAVVHPSVLDEGGVILEVTNLQRI